jgi:hypothetical protein
MAVHNNVAMFSSMEGNKLRTVLKSTVLPSTAATPSTNAAIDLYPYPAQVNIYIHHGYLNDQQSDLLKKVYTS